MSERNDDIRDVGAFVLRRGDLVMAVDRSPHGDHAVAVVVQAGDNGVINVLDLITITPNPPEAP